MAFTPISGTAGRVRVGANTTVSGIKAWKINKQVQVVPIPHFETPADSDGVLWVQHLRGLGGATGTLEGFYDVDGTTKTEGGTPALSAGLAVTLDLLFDKTSPFGYSNVPVTITGFEAGTNVENQAATYTASFTVNGDPTKGIASVP